MKNAIGSKVALPIQLTNITLTKHKITDWSLILQKGPQRKDEKHGHVQSCSRMDESRRHPVYRPLGSTRSLQLPVVVINLKQHCLTWHHGREVFTETNQQGTDTPKEKGRKENRKRENPPSSMESDKWEHKSPYEATPQKEKSLPTRLRMQ